jgi:hypothetical protein
MCCRGQMNLIWPSETVSALHFRGDSRERHDPDAWIFGHWSEADHAIARRTRTRTRFPSSNPSSQEPGPQGPRGDHRAVAACREHKTNTTRCRAIR